MHINAKQVIQGPMALIRFGSCGAVQPDIAVGTVCVCEQGCTLITQNPDAYGHDAPEGEHKFRFVCVLATASFIHE
jgi:uridine phosphorylase